jgi:hypothetical protein
MNENDPLMQQITAALETSPSVQVPSDFAARLMARVPQQKQRRIVVPAISRARYGRYAILAAMLLILVAMLVYAPRSTSNMGLIIQFTLLAELAALALWFGSLRKA